MYGKTGPGSAGPCRSSEKGGTSRPQHDVPPSVSSTLLRGRFRRLAAEIVIVGHAPADVVIHIPGDRARRELLLRVEDLFEQRILARLLLHDLVVDIELLLQDRVGR